MTRQIRDSVTVPEAISRKIDTQKNKTGTGHQQDRGNILSQPLSLLLRKFLLVDFVLFLVTVFTCDCWAR